MKSLYVYIFSATRSFLRKGGEENADDFIPGWAVTSLFRSAAGVVAVGPAGLYHRCVCVAIQTKTLSSQIGAKGITKKVAMFVVIAFCHVLDTYLLQSETALAALSSVFYLSNEAISILENVGRLGVPLPEKLRSILAALKSKENGKQDQ